MTISIAGPEDVGGLARLLWLHAAADEQERQSLQEFAVDLEAWWSEHEHTHLALVARDGDGEVIGMAWLALVPRVPRPGTPSRRSADIQSVFVMPEHRSTGTGSALVRAALRQAARLGAGRVTVQSSRRSVPVYERLGFASSPQLLQTPSE